MPTLPLADTSPVKTLPCTSRLALSPADLDKLIHQFATPQVQSCRSKIEGDRLWLELIIDTGIPLLGRLPTTLSITASRATADTIAIDLQMERALGVAGIVRHFLKSIIQHILPPDLRPHVEVQSNTQVLIRLEKIQMANRPLLELLTFHSLQAPAAPHALTLDFALQSAALPALITTPKPELSAI